MVELIVTPPCAGQKPVTHGAAQLRELPFAQITSISPYAGTEAKVSAALSSAVGAGLPNAGRSLSGDAAEVIWTGQRQYFLIGAEVPQVEAALTDQSDAWARVALEGAPACDVLARLCPLDLRSMDDGDVARTLVGHMAAVVIRRVDGFELMVFRSMAGTLWHEVETAMQSVAARARLLG